MQKKSDAHKALFFLAQHEGVPPMIIMDGSKEQTLGNFKKKAMKCIVVYDKLIPIYHGRMLLNLRFVS